MGRAADIARRGILAACRGGWEKVTKMMSREQNELITRVGADRPSGMDIGRVCEGARSKFIDRLGKVALQPNAQPVFVISDARSRAVATARAPRIATGPGGRHISLGLLRSPLSGLTINAGGFFP